jgi:short subunit dehydrogenase-like uncharacterized protein
MTTRQYDVVVWGATGFTGRLVMEYMVNTYGVNGDVTWAAAARDESKLKAVIVQILGDDAEALPVIIADSQDETSLRALVASTRVVCSIVGPYALYGSKLVALCAELGTHYCDLAGEIPWLRRMMDQYETAAQDSGARIVSTCGFDSIPSDLGTWFVQQQMHARHEVYASRVKCRIVRIDGGMSGGTFASAMNMMEETKTNPELLEIIEDPYALNPLNMPRGEDDSDQSSARYDQDFHQWSGPFAMAPLNVRVVRRSHALLGYPWGQHFRYDEAMLTGNGPGGFAKASLLAGGTGLLMLATRLAPVRQLLGRVAPAPGEGPSPEAIRNGFFEMELLACHPEDPTKNMIALVTGDRDPGYGATSKMLAECAVCLAVDGLNTPAGFLTPSVAMGQKLVDRLSEKAGMSFSIK